MQCAVHCAQLHMSNIRILLMALSLVLIFRLYFSAHWCPPCRRFTPLLAAAYKAHTECIAAENNKEGEDEGDTDDAIEVDEIEVIFISSDSVWTQYNHYRSSMPWLSVPFSNLHSLKIKDELSSKYGVRGIPTLIVLDGKTGEVVTKNGRGEYANYFRGEYSSGPLSGCVVS